MKTHPLVSVVVPTFNQGQYLPVALDSLMFQDYPNIEIIICNHGSADNTSQIINDYISSIKSEKVSFAKKYNEKEDSLIRQYEFRYPQNRKIISIESNENIGATNSYNAGFKKTTGQYCTYLVADDYFLPQAISEMTEVLEQNRYDFVYTDMFIVNDSGRILQHLQKPDYSFKQCLSDWFHLGVSKLYRRNLHERFGFYDPEYRLANDYDMYLRFAINNCKFFHLPKTLYFKRNHNTNDPSEPAAWRNNGHFNLINESKVCAARARAAQMKQHLKYKI